MILTAHQPVYLPWLGLFHKIALADVFVSFNQVQYQMKDWNNRNKIKTSNGPIWLSVPVMKKGRLERVYTDIEIDNSQNWRRKHWSSILNAYRKAPFFKDYSDAIENIYTQDWLTLVQLNEAMLRLFLKMLGIDVRFEYMDRHEFSGVKSDLVLNMCRQLGADYYIFGAQGRDYADVETFSRHGTSCCFQDYRHPEYAQVHGDFISHMSILDLLFNCGDKAFEILMSGNIGRTELIEECRR